MASKGFFLRRAGIRRFLACRSFVTAAFLFTPALDAQGVGALAPIRQIHLHSGHTPTYKPSLRLMQGPRFPALQRRPGIVRPAG